MGLTPITTTLDKSATLLPMVNGSQPSDDERDAQELFPHTRLCTERVRVAATVHGKSMACTCKAVARRRVYLSLLKKARIEAYTDACAKIRFSAKSRAERSVIPIERKAFQEVVSWSHYLEVMYLEKET